MKPIIAGFGLFSLCVLTAACAPVVRGGPSLDLPPGLVETAQVTSIVMSSAWLNVEDDFSDTFVAEVQEELNACAYGTYPLQLRVHVEEVRRANRMGVLVRGHGMHQMRATAELVDPARGGQVMGRYPIVVGAQAGGRIAGMVGDRQMMVSEEFGRALCAMAFERNPRRPGLHNATRG
ncbi:hypothetical protein E4M02_12715 [Brevundimonas sp. S30B]|uniref:hypothetical protein n=1 Tax=unclassified Brevundimonas TaxID=2622653 RepID=UPI001072ACC4|nr:MULTISPECIES: hypothetical protein [unclassified Brevundimonas]QBX36517.1 hypothetical protein E4M01_01365 [Brevundimonas sp. MF30-B]TFW00817.1 hypothetical protein E4M02_12715 [Brevundimonas sp. S30B]